MSLSSKLLRTTVVQAFARTVADDSHRTGLVTKRDGLPGFTPEPPTSVTLPDVGDVVGGHYKLVRLLGQGMFGKVYVAQRVDVPEHQVALKLLPRSLYAGRNVERELVMLATVGHPNVVQLKDHGTTPDYVWLTMPVYSGETLAERLEKKGTLTPRQAYDIFLPMARGLEALHAAGLRHQDVKPENIFLALFGGRVHPILLDLGVAAEKDATFVAGTALYGAPEQVQALSGMPAFEPLSEKMDTYGLAATLLAALVGPKEFPGEHATDRSELAEAHEQRTKEPLSLTAMPDVTGRPRELITAAFRSWLAFSPEQRPTMRELAEQLEVLLEPDAEDVRQEERRRARQQTSILWFKIVLAGMLLIGAAGAVVVFKQRETLAIAADLEKARSEGAKSFTKLETCNAAHTSDQEALVECRASGDRARDDLKQQLEAVMRTGTTSQAEHAAQVQKFMSRIRTCEENATTARRVCDDETARLVAQAANDKAVAADQQRELQKAVEQGHAELLAATAERDKARTERAACVEERDACKAEAKASQDAPSKPAPRGPASAAPSVPDPAYANEEPVTPPQLKEPETKPDAPPAAAPAPPPTQPAPSTTPASTAAAAKGPTAKAPAHKAPAPKPSKPKPFADDLP